MINQHASANLYELYYHPKGLCWQVKHSSSGVVKSFETENSAIQSVIDVDGVFQEELYVMHA